MGSPLANGKSALLRLSQLGAKPTTLYVAALLMLACAAIASHLLVAQSLDGLDEDSIIINRSGLQRTLCEQTLRLTGDLMVSDDPAEIAELQEQLRSSLARMRESHKSLTADVPRFHPKDAAQFALKAAYFDGDRPLDARLAIYFAAIDEILALDPALYSRDLVNYRVLAAAHREGLLRDLDHVVKLYEGQARARLAASEELHVLLMGATLLLLLAEAAFIFRPLIRRLTRINEELEAQNREMAQLAVSDTLTRLPNRSGFGQRLEHLLDAQTGGDRHAAIMLLDLDRFKNVNDTLGHDAGDRVLIEVGARIQQRLKGIDTVARLGGDEFAIIVRRLETPCEASKIARRLIEAIMKPILLKEGEVAVGASIGIATLPRADCDPTQLLVCADLALQQAKRSGRGKFVFYDPAMQKEVRHKTRIADELRSACLEDRLRVFLQPILSFETGKVAYAESLIRWDHSERGMIPAGEFIDIIDEFMMAAQLEEIVYDQVFGMMRQWRRDSIEFPVITLNVSSVNVRQTDFCERLVAAAERHALQPADIALEILESVFDARGAETVTANIRELSRLGFEIILDDFGTGNASLSHLMDMPVNAIKIDKAFVHGLGEEAAPEQIASALLALANDLGIRTIGEGIESAEQMAFLERRGCTFGQGYHFSRPIAKEAFDEKLRAGTLGQNSDLIWLRERRAAS